MIPNGRFRRVIQFAIPVFTANSGTDRSVGCFALIFGARVGLVGTYWEWASNGLDGLTPGNIPERCARHSVQNRTGTYCTRLEGEREGYCTYIQCTKNQSKSSKIEGTR